MGPEILGIEAAASLRSEFKLELVFSAVISQQAPAAEFAAVCVRVPACASVQQPRSSLRAHCDKYVPAPSSFSFLHHCESSPTTLSPHTQQPFSPLLRKLLLASLLTLTAPLGQ